MIAALFVETNGCYFGLNNVDPWDESRDARLYTGPHPIVAHPPCQRWGNFWFGSVRPNTPKFKLGDDGGCFKAALEAVRKWGGVIEHPANSRAWAAFGLEKPKRGKGWTRCDQFGGASCYIEQGHYGHFARKATWLYACKTALPELNWSIGEVRIHPVALAKHGYRKARRIGMIAMVGGKNKTKIRNTTPLAFRDLLLSLARSVGQLETAV